MKIFIFFLFILLTLISCNKANKSEFGKISAKLNGQKWVGKANIIKFKNAEKFSIIVNRMVKMDGGFIPKDVLSLMLLNKTLDIQTLYNPDSLINTTPSLSRTASHFYTNQDDGDETCDNFVVIESEFADNFFIITEQENNYSEIWGEFSANFVKIQSCPSSPYPDTIKVRDGKFHLFLDK